MRLVTSPGSSYAREMVRAIEGSTSFTLISGFATSAGLAQIASSIRGALQRGGRGSIIVAVDRQGFNTAAVFEELLELKAAFGARLRVGLALEEAGLMHAKALFVQSPVGDELLVGSANLTRGALGTNHELGVLVDHVPAEMRRAFDQFATSIAPRSLDGEDARAFLEARGLLAGSGRETIRRPTPRETPQGLAELFARLPPLAPLDIPAEVQLATWIQRGYLVGRGRQGLEAFVLRFPQEQFLRSGYIRPVRAEALGRASHETRRLGYGIDLIPTADKKILRRDSRRVSMLLGRLTLNLPCFGLWMPETYWEVFLEARTLLRQKHSLAPERIRELAVEHRTYLLAGGLEREIELILDRLDELEVLVPGKRTAVEGCSIDFFRAELSSRTPEVLASCVEFRTARQRWAPYDQTEAPYRQLMVDIVQAAFRSTYRTGDWPRRITSHAGRQIVRSVEEGVGQARDRLDGRAAVDLLAQASTWEIATRDMQEVVAEFRRIIDDDLTFPAPELEALTDSLVNGASLEDGEDEDDDV